MLHLMAGLALFGLLVILWPAIIFGIKAVMKFFFYVILVAIFCFFAFPFIQAAIPFFESVYLLAKGLFNYMIPDFDRGWIGLFIGVTFLPLMFYIQYKQRRGEWLL